MGDTPTDSTAGSYGVGDVQLSRGGRGWERTSPSTDNAWPRLPARCRGPAGVTRVTGQTRLSVDRRGAA